MDSKTKVIINFKKIPPPIIYIKLTLCSFKIETKASYCFKTIYISKMHPVVRMDIRTSRG